MRERKPAVVNNLLETCFGEQLVASMNITRPREPSIPNSRDDPLHAGPGHCYRTGMYSDAETSLFQCVKRICVYIYMYIHWISPETLCTIVGNIGPGPSGP